MDFRALAKEYIRELTPYQPGKPIEEVERELGISSAIKLASNENPLGASSSVIAACQEELHKMQLYPDGGSFALKQSLAKFLQVNTDQLTIGNGSENILELIVKAYLMKGDSAVISQYAFLTIPILIKSYGAEIIAVAAQDFRHDIKKMAGAITDKTRMVFVVNPNNPTGTYTSSEEMRYLLQSVPEHVLVIVDEAYHEYIQREDYPDTLQLLQHYPNLIVTRTFSKAYGLAALRLGYAISSPAIADILNRARLPFNVNSIAAVAGIAALQDQQHIVKSIAVNNAGKQYLENELQKLQLAFIPSLGNFITLDVKKSANVIFEKLLNLGMIVRPLTAYDMHHYIRVTIGTQEQNEKFIKGLQTVI